MENGALLGDIPRLAQSVSKGPVQKEHAWRSGRIGNLLYEGKGNRRYTRCLDLSCEQSHGSRADGSGRDEQHQINMCVSQPARNLSSGDKQRFRTSAEAKADVLVCSMTDDALCFEFTQALQWEDEIDVTQGVRSVIRLVGNREVAVLCIARDNAK